ncbi:MAG TPA: DUF4199 domain-containing protein [Bacteroidia bacterium]|nr:DUF4199 domain-containing protein [Bacteroidia bacterium]
MFTKISLFYGSLAGLFLGCVMLTFFYLGYNTRGNGILTIIHIIVSLSGSFLPIFIVRKKLGGEIVFKSALWYGVTGALMMTVAFTFMTAIYYNFVNPNFADKYLADIEISLKHNGSTAEEIKSELMEWRKEMSPTNLILKVFMSFSTLGLVLSLVNSLILCKKD